MELYIEKEFLDNFYLEFKGTKVQNILKTIFKEYGNKIVFMDIVIDSVMKLEELKEENGFFKLICDSESLAPIPIESIKNHLFEKSNFEQTIVFLDKEEVWFKEAEQKGVLCFSYNTYEEKILKIIDNMHFKLDLSEPFVSWSFLKCFSVLSFNKLRISDNYILSDKTNQKIDDNIIPILAMLLENRDAEIKVETLTKDLNPISEDQKHKKEKAKKVHKKLNRLFAKSKAKFTIIMNDINSRFVMHDRNIATNFSLLDIGQGFNLIPHKESNSQIISETIFEKYTYNRLNRILKEQNEYIDKLNKLETVKFKMYPEN